MTNNENAHPAMSTLETLIGATTDGFISERRSENTLVFRFGRSTDAVSAYRLIMSLKNDMRAAAVQDVSTLGPIIYVWFAAA
jgi:thiamine biosynthesis protein ThiC